MKTEAQIVKEALSYLREVQLKGGLLASSLHNVWIPDHPEAIPYQAQIYAAAGIVPKNGYWLQDPMYVNAALREVL